MLATATITYDIADLTGVDFDSRRTRVWVTTNIPDGTIADTVGNQVRLGDGRGSLADDGTGSATVWVPGTGSNPASWQTTLHVDYQPRGGGGRVVRTFGPFTITADANLADLIPEQTAPPEYAGALLAQMTALRDQTASISGIATTDDAIDAALKLSGGKAATTLAASYAELANVNLMNLGADPTGVVPIDTIYAQALSMLPVSTQPGAYGYPEGTIELGVGTFKVAGNLPNAGPHVTVQGQGERSTFIDHHGNGACFRFFSKWFETDGWAIPDENSRGGGGINGLLIDGTNASPGAIGLWYGDVMGFRHRIHVRNYAGAGSIGILQRQMIKCTEKTVGDSWIWNCDTCFEVSGDYATGTVTIVDPVTLPATSIKISSLPETWPHPYSSSGTPLPGALPQIYVNGQIIVWKSYTQNGDGTVTLNECTGGTGSLTAGMTVQSNTYSSSMGYNENNIRVGCGPNQNGAVFKGGTDYYSGIFRLAGNFYRHTSVQTNAAITITGTGYPGGRTLTTQNTIVQDCSWDVQVECYGPGTNGPKTYIFGTTANRVHRSYGVQRFNPTGQWVSAALPIGSAQVRVVGPMLGDTSINPDDSTSPGLAIKGPLLFQQADANGGTGQFNLNDGDFCSMVMSSGLTSPATVLFNTPRKGPQRKTLIIKQPSSGTAKLLTWPTSASPTVTTPTVKWAGGTAPTLSTANNAIDIIELVTIDGATWYGRALNGFA